MTPSTQAAPGSARRATSTNERGERSWLRVGIVLGQRLVEERLLAPANDVTIGTSARSTFVVPSPALPPRWRLFEERRGRRWLRLHAAMAARIATGTAVQTLDAAARAPTSDRSPRPIALPDGARGRITAGDATILFQTVRRPEPRPRPRLPVSVRRRLLREIDPLFVALIAAAALGHLALVVYLRQVDWPRRPAIDELPDRFVHEVVRAPARRPPAPPEPETTPDREPAPPPAADRPSRPARPDRPAPATAAERRAVIAEQVSRMGLLAVIGRRTPDGSAAIADLLASGAPDRAQEEAFRDIGGVSVATAERELRSLRPAGGGGPRLATPGALRGPGAIAAPAATGEVRERSARPHVRLDRPELDGGRGDPALLAREVRARLGAIRACYERALKQQPSLAGKLVVAFTITAAGTVSAVEIDEDTLSEAAPGMTACVRGSIRQWRFSPQGEGSVELRFPFVFQSSG